jgi:hypothetical protein
MRIANKFHSTRYKGISMNTFPQQMEAVESIKARPADLKDLLPVHRPHGARELHAQKGVGCLLLKIREGANRWLS